MPANVEYTSSEAWGRLNDKQRAFVREYCIDFNATQAACRAGYSIATAKQQGHRLLTHADAQECLRLALLARAERTNSKADQVLEEVERLVYFDPGEVMSVRSVEITRSAGDDEDDEEWDGAPVTGEKTHITDVQFKDWDKLTPAQRRQFGSIKVDAKGALAVRFRDRDGHLVNLMKHHGLLKERIEHEASDELMKLLDARRDRARGRTGRKPGEESPRPRAGKRPKIGRG